MAVVVLSCVATGAGAAPPDGRAGEALRDALAIEDRAAVVIALDAGAQAARAPDVVAAARARSGAADVDPTFVYRSLPGFAATVSRAGLAALLADPSVLRVDLDAAGGAGLAESRVLIHADDARRLGMTGAGVVVALVDSGVEAAHPDLAGRVVAEHCFCRDEQGRGCCPGGVAERAGAGSAADDYGHGTQMAGIVASAGQVAPPGVAPLASLVAIRVLDANGRFSGTAQVLAALDWLLAERPDVSVVNLSLGTDVLFTGPACDQATAYTIVLAEAVAALNRRGTLVVAAGMNAGSTTAIAAPACLSGVLAVGAVHDEARTEVTPGGCREGGLGGVACFSNTSPALDLLAPGSWITSTFLHGTVMSGAGTSQACAHVSGVAALVRQANPELDGAAVDRVLAETGEPVVDARVAREFRRVDSRAAVLRALGDTADLRASFASISVGEELVEATAVVENLGPRNAEASVELSLPLDLLVRPVAADGGRCELVVDRLVCPLGVLEPGVAARARLVLRLPPAGVSVVARAVGQPGDPSPANDAATLELPVPGRTVRRRVQH